MAARHRSVETKYMEDRDKVLRGLRRLDRRTFLKVLGASAGAVMAKGLMPPHTFQLVNVADASVDKNASATGAPGTPPFTFAYISDTHMYVRTLNQRFVKGAVKAVEDVNALDPQPDFVSVRRRPGAVGPARGTASRARKSSRCSRRRSR